MLLEQRIGRKVCRITTRSEDNRSMFSKLLAILLIVDTDDFVSIFEDFGDFGLFENLDSIRDTLRQIFQLYVNYV